MGCPRRSRLALEKSALNRPASLPGKTREGDPKLTAANLMNLMHQVELMNVAPRCSAKSKRSQQQCRAPALKAKRSVAFTTAMQAHRPAVTRRPRMVRAIDVNQIFNSAPL